MSDRIDQAVMPSAPGQDASLNVTISGAIEALEVAALPADTLPVNDAARLSTISALEIGAKAASAAAKRPADPHDQGVLQRADVAEQRVRNVVVPPSDPGLSPADAAAEARLRETGQDAAGAQGRGPNAGASTATDASSADTMMLATASLASTAAATTYTGTAGADSMVGSSGNDIFIGSPGPDTIRGLAGQDAVDYSASGAPLTITLTSLTTSTASTKPSGGDASGDVLYSIEDVVGTASADLISGNQFNNNLAGGAGDDTVKGGSGNDALQGDDGADLLDGGSGLDTIHGGGGDDFVLGGFGSDELYGDAGADLISAGDGDDQLDGGDGDDELIGSLGNDTLRGAAGNDNLKGSLGDDELYGDDGADALDAADGNDKVYGGAGDDWLTGGLGADTLAGGEGNDIVDGGDGNDNVSGGAGADTLIGGGGADALNGGAGIDVADYSGAGGSVGVDLTANSGTGAALGDTYIGIENVTGSSFGDILVGNAADNVFVGGAGADTLIGQGGTDTADYSASAAAVSLQFSTTLIVSGSTASGFSGSGGDAEGDAVVTIERLIGSAFNDIFVGGDLNDIFIGGLGADALDGGGGLDTADYSFSTAGMTVDLQAGTASDGDTLVNMERVIGSAFGDVLYGNGAANWLEGGDGNDLLRGGAGPDTLLGGAGIDTADYSGSAGGVLIQLSNNADPLVGLGSGQTNAGFPTSDAAGDLLSQVENVVGSAFTDDLRGSTAANKLVTGAGNDIVRGGSGADLLVVNGINGTGGFKQLIGDGIGDGGSAGVDTYRIIGSGATTGANLTLINGYQLGENIEVNSVSAAGTGNLTLGATTYRTVVLQGTTPGAAHDTRILVGVMTADATQQQALVNQSNAWLNVILATGGANDLDGDGRDLSIQPNLSADDPWG
jgi:Ca2+-binding RTX toxin-like protein